MKKLLLSFILILFWSPSLANSAEIITNSNVLLDQNSIYSENLYVGSGFSQIAGQVDADLVVVSLESVITSRVTGDIILGGGNVKFAGEVLGDLRIVGGEISISGKVEGDLVIIGAKVFVSKDASLLGDILLVGGEINFEGDSPKRLKVIAGKINLNSKVDGQTEITTQALTLGSNSVISGNFSYFAPAKFWQAEGAQVLGTVNYNKISTLRDIGIVQKTIVNFLNFWLLLRFITTLILAFILVYVFRVFSVEVSKIIRNSFWKSLLAGILSILLVPIAIVFLFVSLFALPVGFLLLLAFIFLLILAPAISGILLGSLIVQKFNKKKDYLVNFQTATVGVVVYTLLQFLPYLGSPARLILVLIALGATVRYLRVLIFK